MLVNELWRRRGLICTLAKYEIKVRYRGSVLGIAWSMVEPLLMFGILLFFFTNISKTQIENYPIYLIMGLLLWGTFSRTTGASLTALISKKAIMTSVFIPKEVFVISTALSSFAIMGFELAVLGGFFVVFGFMPPWSILLLPIPLLALVLVSVGLSFPLSALNVYYRDTGYLWGVIVHAGYFATPIMYSVSMFSEGMRHALYLNPMTWILETARTVGISGGMPDWQLVGGMYGIAALVLALGWLAFRRLSGGIAEEV
jgi:lipopolysaccharide transport system permease protein